MGWKSLAIASFQEIGNSRNCGQSPQIISGTCDTKVGDLQEGFWRSCKTLYLSSVQDMPDHCCWSNNGLSFSHASQISCSASQNQNGTLLTRETTDVVFRVPDPGIQGEHMREQEWDCYTHTQAGPAYQIKIVCLSPGRTASHIFMPLTPSPVTDTMWVFSTLLCSFIH